MCQRLSVSVWEVLGSGGRGDIEESAESVCGDRQEFPRAVTTTKEGSQEEVVETGSPELSCPPEEIFVSERQGPTMSPTAALNSILKAVTSIIKKESLKSQ